MNCLPFSASKNSAHQKYLPVGMRNMAQLFKSSASTMDQPLVEYSAAKLNAGGQFLSPNPINTAQVLRILGHHPYIMAVFESHGNDPNAVVCTAALIGYRMSPRCHRCLKLTKVNRTFCACESSSSPV